MSDFEKEATLRSVLLKAAKSGERMRFYGPGMMIVAEGQIAFVGEDVVGIKHGKTEEADEFVCIECIIKVQTLGEYRHY
ncbi:MAG: hypothetical protein AM325_001310 [Candidatus Thorarchaeota archaeon SMTZ1-45]|nr:MAG: hypothetical protein AM325_03130 [Candidatus Thorarchaeota archaeon SMTZ1-45]